MKVFIPCHSVFIAKKIFGFALFSQLSDAVNCLAKENSRLLVLGRKHMLMNSSNWKREIMKEMQNKADFFFAENM